MTTLRDCRYYAEMAAGWCVGRPDLESFAIRVVPAAGGFAVTLAWPGRPPAERVFPLAELSWRIDPRGHVRGELDRLAAASRREIAAPSAGGAGAPAPPRSGPPSPS